MGFLDGATMENLPDVILSDIFIRLQAKQLAQMRCVSKSWNSLLSESLFIKSHLNRSLQNNKNDGVLLLFPKVISFASKPFTAHPSRSPDLELTNFIKLPVNPQSNIGRGKVIGSINGLICFKYGSNHDDKVPYGMFSDDEVIHNYDPDVIYIWNPSLSSLLTLPPYHIPSHSFHVYLRFVYDPKTDDYKVVKVSRHIEVEPDYIKSNDWLPVEIYSMRKGSWNLINQEIPSDIAGLLESDILCLDGHHSYLHWLAQTHDRLNSYTLILAFDLGAEAFREIPLPDSITDLKVGDNEYDPLIDLAYLAGKVCVITYVLPDYECEVWVMNEYGVAESWVKLHDFLPFSGGLHTYGITSHSEFLTIVAEDDVVWNDVELVLYDPLAAKTKKFRNYYGENCKVGKVVEYVDSLVWVTPVEQREMSCSGISRFQF